MRIAIFGGTFDPIHNGHLAAAETVAGLFEVEEFHFVTSFSPPHKVGTRLTSPFHRFAMTALAMAPFSRFQASTLELDYLDRRYTVDTLAEMARLFPEAQRLFVLGTDMYAEIDTWKDYRRLFELAHIVVVHRPGFTFRLDVAPFTTLEANTTGVSVPSGPEAPTVFYAPFVEQPISSTRIRNEWASGGAVRQWVPPAVRRYIEKHNLYSQATS